MFRNTWKPAFALGAVLATCGATSADDRDTRSLFAGPSSTTMTLGGQGTAAQAATEDNELTGRGWRGYGWRGGWGWNAGWNGGWNRGWGWNAGWNRGWGWGGGWNGGWGGWNAGWNGGGFRPVVVSSFPVYAVPSIYYSSCSIGIGGVGTGAPAVQLGTSFAQPAASQPMPQPTAPGDGTFPYDGGPANPVPLPKADPNAIPPANPSSTATDLPISLKPKTAAPAYKYKAYGEK